MRRALPPTLALVLATGIGFVGPALVQPEPIDPMADDTVATLTAMRIATMPNVALPGSDGVRTLTNDRTTERTNSCNTP